jgi:hypothetical protein
MPGRGGPAPTPNPAWVAGTEPSAQPPARRAARTAADRWQPRPPGASSISPGCSPAPLVRLLPAAAPADHPAEYASAERSGAFGRHRVSAAGGDAGEAGAGEAWGAGAGRGWRPAVWPADGPGQGSRAGARSRRARAVRRSRSGCGCPPRSRSSRPRPSAPPGRPLPEPGDAFPRRPAHIGYTRAGAGGLVPQQATFARLLSRGDSVPLAVRAP